MEITIKAEAKEMAAFVLAIQERRDMVIEKREDRAERSAAAKSAVCYYTEK